MFKLKIIPPKRIKKSFHKSRSETDSRSETGSMCLESFLGHYHTIEKNHHHQVRESDINIRWGICTDKIRFANFSAGFFLLKFQRTSISRSHEI